MNPTDKGEQGQDYLKKMIAMVGTMTEKQLEKSYYYCLGVCAAEKNKTDTENKSA